MRARAIVMSLPPRRTGSSLFGKTLETVLAERPCRVIIDSSRGLREAQPAGRRTSPVTTG
jgi:APA family basic amino acid/polyamine antiporter